MEEKAKPEKMDKSWEPKILAILCRWCSYAGADLTGSSRISYPPNIRILRVPCSGRVDPLFILKALRYGLDGVLVSGCHPGDCHYTAGNYNARRKFTVFRNLLEFSGIDLGRVWFSWISAAEGGKWVETIRSFTDSIREQGPFSEYREMIDVR